MADGIENRIHLNNLSPGDVALLKDIAEAAADKAVAKAFTSMGIDYNDPIASQALFGSLRRMSDEDEEADRAWTRRTRMRMEGAVGKAIMSAIGLAMVGGAHAMWHGIKAVIAR
jgi:hypothetical protein